MDCVPAWMPLSAEPVRATRARVAMLVARIERRARPRKVGDISIRVRHVTRGRVDRQPPAGLYFQALQTLTFAE